MWHNVPACHVPSPLQPFGFQQCFSPPLVSFTSGLNRVRQQHPTCLRQVRTTVAECRCSTVYAATARRLHIRAHSARDGSPSRKVEHTEFQGLVSRLLPLSFQELQQLCEDGSPDSQAAYSASFLFWLSGQEKQATGPAKQELSNLAAQLVYIKEQADWEASRRMLPPLASSLAYSNYSTWQAQHEGQALPEVAPGVSIPDLYKAAEREEAKLKQWQSPQRQGSTLDSFAATSGYQQMAADAMARVRARLSGWADDDTFMSSSSSGTAAGSTAAAAAAAGSSSRISPAAEKVLQQLLSGCCCREERATVLPDAFMPPGLEIPAPDGDEGIMKIVTTPQKLLAVVAHQMQQLTQQQPRQQLPSGEALQQVLTELQEDITEYDTHVYSKMTKRDMLGRF